MLAFNCSIAFSIFFSVCVHGKKQSIIADLIKILKCFVSLCLSWWKRGHAFRRTDQFIYSIFFSLVFNMVILLMRLQSKCSGVPKSTNSLVLGAHRLALTPSASIAIASNKWSDIFAIECGAIALPAQWTERILWNQGKKKEKKRKRRKKIVMAIFMFLCFHFLHFFRSLLGHTIQGTWRATKPHTISLKWREEKNLQS